MNLNGNPPFDRIIKDDHQDHQHQGLHFNSTYGFSAVSSPSSSSASSRILFNNVGYYPPPQLGEPRHQEDDHQSYCHDQGVMEDKVKGGNGIEVNMWKDNNDNEKWTPSPKMKRPKKQVKTVQHQHPSSSLESDFSSSNNSPIRVCSDCNTTKTPLWRSGPNGPKSLCNACGIRQRKARRAMVCAAAASGVVVAAYEKPPPPALKIKDKKKKMGRNGMKKCCKAAIGVGSSPKVGEKKANFEEFLIKLSNNLALQRVFPQEEKDAAILLMAISSGLVHG